MKISSLVGFTLVCHVIYIDIGYETFYAYIEVLDWLPFVIFLTRNATEPKKGSLNKFKPCICIRVCERKTDECYKTIESYLWFSNHFLRRVTLIIYKCIDHLFWATYN